MRNEMPLIAISTGFTDYGDYLANLRASSLDQSIAPLLLFETSRGCWWGAKSHCTFCGLNSDSMAFNAKPAPQVLDELAQLAQRHGVARFCAADNIMALEHIEQVFGVLESCSPGWRFFYEIKSNLSETRLRTLADSYKRYLENFFRKRFKLVGTPVRFVFKEGSNPYEGKKNVLTERQVAKKRRLIRHVKRGK